MLLFYTSSEKVLGNLVWIPCLNLGTGMSTILLFVSLFALDVRHAVVQVGAVFAARVSSRRRQGAVEGRGPHVGNVFVNNVESFVQHVAVLARI